MARSPAHGPAPPPWWPQRCGGRAPSRYPWAAHGDDCRGRGGRRMNIDLRHLYTTLRDQLGPVGHWWPHESRTEQAVGAVLVQQNRWARAAQSVAALRDHVLPDPDRLAAATPAEVAVSIRPSGLVRAKSAALPALGRWMAEHEAEVENWSDEELTNSLWSLPLVGPETADVIALYSYDRPTFVADAY